MSDDRAINAAVDDLAATVATIIPPRINELAIKPQSPIERAFLIGLMAFGHAVPIYDFGDTRSRVSVNKTLKGIPWVRVTLQAPILSYKADFLLTVFILEEEVGRVVIECDGHDFHERTPDQAARDRSRDRAMTLAGYKVLRFTGREINRDLMVCVNDAHEAVWQTFEAGVTK